MPIRPSVTDPARLASVIDASGAALVAVDAQGQTVLWSRGAEALFGWTPDEVLGRPPPIVPAALRAEWQLQMQRVLETGSSTPAAETQRLARDGRLIPVVRTSSPLRGPDGGVIGLLDTLTDITTLKQLQEESRALAQIRERELTAMDLHDGLIQSLYALVLTLDARQRDLTHPSGTAARDALEAARQDLERVIEETRSYLFNLRAQKFVPSDLGSGLRLLADAIRLNGNAIVDLQLDADAEKLLEAEVRGHLLYLAREAISNVLRHAQARTVRLSVARAGDRMVLTVSDDGRGFDTSSRAPAGSHGLRNMAERARLVGGRLDIQSTIGQGTRVRFEAPTSHSDPSSSLPQESLRGEESRP
jgi:PAS domain S-box-containing protein